MVKAHVDSPKIAQDVHGDMLAAPAMEEFALFLSIGVMRPLAWHGIPPVIAFRLHARYVPTAIGAFDSRVEWPTPSQAGFECDRMMQTQR
jgi:hypothetical protein